MYDYDFIKFSVNTEGYVYMRAEKDHGNWDKAKYLNFMFSKDEWIHFVEAKYWNHVYCDVGHRLEVAGDLCWYYDFPYPSNNVKEMCIKFQSFEISPYIRKIVDRYLRLHNELEISPERFKSLCKRYGRGKGIVDVIVAPEVKERFVKDIKNSKFAFRIRNLVHGTKNSTNKFNQKAKLYISNDGDKSYYFVEKNYNGNFIMNGGIINHGSESEPDWSVHT